MNESEKRDNTTFTYRQIILESLIVFLMLALYGYWPTPDVNEQYYIGKAIHFWNPDWLSNDTFFKTPDSHWFFYATFGLFSKFFSPVALAWFGRITAWLLTAFAWQCLSRTLIPVRYAAIGTVCGLLFFLDAFHLAGEWLVGGIEGKGYAFPLVFWGLALFCQRRYSQAWLALGLASAFHVLVGGWTVLALLPVWLFETWSSAEQGRISAIGRGLKRMAPGLILGGLVALLGLLPALALDSGADAKTARLAHQIYVFVRLPHHLVPSLLPWIFPVRFFALVAVTILLACLWRRTVSTTNASDRIAAMRIFTRFVFVAVAIAFCGLLLDYGSLLLVKWEILADRYVTADLLRFYFFRLSDWAVPAGLAFLACDLFTRVWPDRSALTVPRIIRFTLVAAGSFTLVKCLLERQAQAVATAATIDPNFPVAPRPVTAIAFLLTVCILAGFVLLANRTRIDSAEKNSLDHARVLSLALLLFLAAPLYYTVNLLNLKSAPLLCRSEPPKASIAAGWRQACDWIRGNTPEEAVFLTPRDVDSFKWCANRAQAGTWKEMPQDATSIVRWYKRMERLYTVPNDTSRTRWNQALVVVMLAKGPRRVYDECRELGLDWIIAEAPPWYMTTNETAQNRWNEFLADSVWSNTQYTIIRVPEKSATTDP
ncbi:MAG: hypothetical protein Q4G68_11830 [Planctomycetia bacterium]|nr:hypothetical protein [Planctomycetia bacterium]